MTFSHWGDFLASLAAFLTAGGALLRACQNHKISRKNHESLTLVLKILRGDDKKD